MRCPSFVSGDGIVAYLCGLVPTFCAVIRKQIDKFPVLWYNIFENVEWRLPESRMSCIRHMRTSVGQWRMYGSRDILRERRAIHTHDSCSAGCTLLYCCDCDHFRLYRTQDRQIPQYKEKVSRLLQSDRLTMCWERHICLSLKSWGNRIKSDSRQIRFPHFHYNTSAAFCQG